MYIQLPLFIKYLLLYMLHESWDFVSKIMNYVHDLNNNWSVNIYQGLARKQFGS